MSAMELIIGWYHPNKSCFNIFLFLVIYGCIPVVTNSCISQCSMVKSCPMTDPNGAAIYGVPWIPSIYPSHVSIFLPAPWIRHGCYKSPISTRDSRCLSDAALGLRCLRLCRYLGAWPREHAGQAFLNAEGSRLGELKSPANIRDFSWDWGFFHGI